MRDESGLDFLLAETAKNKSKEWATLHHGEICDDSATINKILTFEDLEKDGVRTKKYIYGVRTFYNPSNYTGHIHYHTKFLNSKFGALNYRVSLSDRFDPRLNTIDFLCFNVSGEQEIIGFNRLDTFIPKDRNDKSVLMKADKEAIIRYLNT